MDTDDLTATVREARAERDEAAECLAIARKRAVLVERDLAFARGERDLLKRERDSWARNRDNAVAILEGYLVAAKEERDEARAGLHDWNAHYVKACKERDEARAELDHARTALVEIIRAFSDEGPWATADKIAEAKRLAHGIVGAVITHKPYGFTPSMADACTVRDMTTDQSKIRNGAGMTQAEREAFWEGSTFETDRGSFVNGPRVDVRFEYRNVAGPEPVPETWIVFEKRLDDPGWREISRQEATSALDAIKATVTPPMPNAWFCDSDRTMAAVPASALGEGFAVNATVTTDTQVTVTPKEPIDVQP